MPLVLPLPPIITHRMLCPGGKAACTARRLHAGSHYCRKLTPALPTLIMLIYVRASTDLHPYGRGHEIQLYLALRDPAPALTISEAAAARGALQGAGFGEELLNAVLRWGTARMTRPAPRSLTRCC